MSGISSQGRSRGSQGDGSPRMARPNPGVGGEHRMPQRLDERPLAIDRLMQQLRPQAAGPFDGLAPEPIKDVPRLAEAGRGPPGASWSGPDTAGPARPRPGPDVDAIDRQVWISPWTSTSTSSTPRITTPLSWTPRNRASVRSTARNGAALRSTRSNREPRISARVKSAMRQRYRYPPALRRGGPLVRAGEVVYARRNHRLCRGSTAARRTRRYARDVAQLGQRTCFGIISELALCYPASLQLTHDRKWPNKVRSHTSL
jgi:hypothetical protein